MKIKKNDYGFEVIPDKPDGTPDTLHSFNLREETVKQMGLALPVYFGEQHMNQHYAQKEWNKITSQRMQENQLAINELNAKFNRLPTSNEGVIETLRGRFEILLGLFKENTDAVGKIQDELQEMPSGWRNSQDIKKLQKRVEELNELLQPGSRVTVHSRLSDLEDAKTYTFAKMDKYDNIFFDLEEKVKKLEACGNVQWMQGIDKKIADLEQIARVMSKAFDDTKVRHEDHYQAHVSAMEIAKSKVLDAVSKDIRGLQEDQRAHTKDICELQKEMHIHRINNQNTSDALNTHLRKCAAHERCASEDYSQKIAKMEECCRNTVAAGKAVEKKVEFLQSTIANHDARLNQHREDLDGLTKQAVRAQKFMEKLREL